MDIKNFGNPLQSAKDQAQGVAGKLTEQVTEISAAAQEQLNDILEEYQKILPLAESLGLTIGSFKLEMGLVPEIRTSLIGSVERINKEAVQKLIAAHQNNKLLVMILNALLITKDLQHKLNIKALKGIQVDIKLGISPNVAVHLTP
jgi:Rad3-related DNA helicase